jgi:Tol biopolymer transport system component
VQEAPGNLTSEIVCRNLSLATTFKRGLVLLTWVLLGALMPTACSGDNEPPADPTTAPTEAVVQTPSLAPGDTRLLIGHGFVLELVTLSGESETLLQIETGRIINVALSPSGKQVAFIIERPAYTDENGQINFGADLHVASADGSGARLLVEHATIGDYYEAPAWLDEDTILVGWRGFDTADGGFNRIERVDAETGQSEVLLQDATMGALSPDRELFAYTTLDRETRVQHLVIESLHDSDEPRILVDETDGLALFSGMAFSPDGSQLAFAAVDVSNPPPPPAPSTGTLAVTHPFGQDIWMIDAADGSALRRLAELVENMPSVSWSGDGSNIYVYGPTFFWRIDPVSGDAEMLQETGNLGTALWLEGE